MLCFIKIPVAKKFMDKRGCGEYQHTLSVEIFLSHSAEKYVAESFSVSVNSCIEKC